jgi:hypothetical protein
MTDDERMMNLGVEIDTVKFGKIKFYELCLEDVQTLVRKLAVFLVGMTEDKLKGDNNALVVDFLSSPESLDTVYCLLAASSRKKREEFSGTGVKDALKMFKGFMEVNDIMELKKLFFGLFPKILAEEQKVKN